VSDAQNREGMTGAVNAIVVAPALQILRLRTCELAEQTLRQSGAVTPRTRVVRCDP